MAKALVTAMIGLMVLSASANASDHRTGTYGYHGRYAGPTTRITLGRRRMCRSRKTGVVVLGRARGSRA